VPDFIPPPPDPDDLDDYDFSEMEPPAPGEKMPPATPPISQFRTSVQLTPATLQQAAAEWDEETPYPFDEPDSELNLVFIPETAQQPRPVVRGGTLEKLVQRLTYEKYPDTDFVTAFLLTYRSFTTPPELLALLIARYDVPELKEATEKERQEFVKNQQHPIRLRVFNVLRAWVANYFYDFAEDRSLVETLLEFISQRMMTTGMEKAAAQLKRLAYRKLEGHETDNDTIMFSHEPPKSIVPSNMHAGISLMELDPVEVARQLTLVEYGLYRKIMPQECLGQAWTKTATRTEKAPNIMAMIARFNHVSRWMATEIIKEPDLKRRGALLNRIIQIAAGCEELNNYNAMMEIISGLQCASIFRLKQTWALVDKKQMRKYEAIRDLMSRERNFHLFREHLHSVDPPCIPYVGVYLTDLTFIEDGNQDYLSDSKVLINFDKRRKISQVIREIQQYQQTPYCLEAVPSIQGYLLKAEFWGENETYETSLKLEAKGTPAPPTKTVSTKNFFRPRSKDKGSKTQKTPEVQPEPSPSSSQPAKEEEEDFGELEVISGYKFCTPDSKENILLDIDVSAMVEGARPSIRAATLEKIIERLTHEKFPDPAMVNTFLLTYKTFTTAREVLALLAMRFNVPRPINKDLHDKYEKSKVMPIRLRVFNVLKTWVDRYFHDCLGDSEFLATFEKLTDTMASCGMDKPALTLKQGVARQLDGTVKYPDRLLVGKSPKPFLPKNLSSNPRLMDFHSEEIARQLTLVEHGLFQRIKPFELLKNAWLSPDAATTRAPNIIAMMQRADHIRDWVATEIITQESPDDAAAYITQWIKIAEKCLTLNNFNSMVEIISGLQLPDIQKLKLVWSSVSAKNTFNKLKGLTEHNYAKLQDKIHNIQPPCLPYLGAYLTALSDLEGKHPDMLEGLINFEKRSLIGSAIMEITQYQNTLYCLEEVPFIQDWMAGATVFSATRINEESVLLLTRGPKPKSRKERSGHATMRGAPKEVDTSCPDGASTDAGAGGAAPGGGGTLTRTGSVRGQSGGGNKKVAKLFGVEEKVIEESNKRISLPSGGATTNSARRSSGGARLSGGTQPPPPVATAGGGSPRPSWSERRSSGSPNGSSGELGIDKQSALKFQMLSIFLDDAEFRQDIQEVLLKDLTAAISREMNEFKAALRNELARAGGGTGGGLPAPKEAIQKHFPGKTVSVWTGSDVDGSVFGWPETVAIHTVVDGRNSFLADVRDVLTKADVATLLRVAKFYAQTTRSAQQPKLYLFARHIDDDSRAIAQRSPDLLELVTL